MKKMLLFIPMFMGGYSSVMNAETIVNPTPKFTQPSPNYCGDDCSISSCCTDYGNRDGRLVDLGFAMQNQEATMVDLAKFVATFCSIGNKLIKHEDEVHVLDMDMKGETWVYAKIQSHGTIGNIYFDFSQNKVVCGEESWRLYKDMGLFQATDLF